ncbi:lasso peptide biosynthesis B2 protein [Bacillus cereus]|uniref:Stage V sporulation protein S n=1 Tax=Bacillus cereus TaxID=1396 RepID=A0AA44QEN4_BACCE|nr:lasso peptide biosynthesis B2 protein [Bacillus cereus]PFN07045.1 stage V sporulation protein S [Bacillus cereus]PFS08050.1 stage V sporulation protein S [Bacillus cereus]PGZ12833.1 stage V sporulation protein S [Bacillus cereus]
MKKVRKFLALNKKTKLLFVETFFLLGWARILKMIPFSKVAPFLGKKEVETTFALNEWNKETLKEISRAIHIMSQHTFWESQCLVKAMAAMKMLEKRGIESTLYLGMAKDEEGELIAHAWLRSGSYYITGSEGMERFTVVGKFAKKMNNKKD